MELFEDFTDFIDLMNKFEVPYMVVGGYAVMAHGEPRFTEDFDIWIKPSVENGVKMMKVLAAFGFVLKGLTNKDFEKEDIVIQLGYAPGRIDILGSISGITFDEAYPERVLRKLGDIDIWFIGLGALIRNKESTNREKDRVDVKQLKKLLLKRK